MLGSCVVHPPLSRNEICSEQTCLLPTLLTWQCALIHVSNVVVLRVGNQLR